MYESGLLHITLPGSISKAHFKVTAKNLEGGFVGVEMQYLDETPDIVVEDVRINNDESCLTNKQAPKEAQSRLTYPTRLKFGESAYAVSNKCSPLKVTIKTDRGEFAYSFSKPAE